MSDWSDCSCKFEDIQVEHDDKHCAFYCASCNEWLTMTCDNTECRFCKGRPDKPLEEH